MAIVLNFWKVAQTSSKKTCDPMWYVKNFVTRFFLKSAILSLIPKSNDKMQILF